MTLVLTRRHLEGALLVVLLAVAWVFGYRVGRVDFEALQELNAVCIIPAPAPSPAPRPPAPAPPPGTYHPKKKHHNRTVGL